MIQDTKPYKLMNQYRPKAADGDSRLLIFRSKEVLCRTEGELLIFPTAGELVLEYQNTGKTSPELRYLFSIGPEDFFMPAEIWDPEDAKLLGTRDPQDASAKAADLLAGSWQFTNINNIRELLPMENVLAAATGWHLAWWYRQNQRCGICGHVMEHDPALRALKCPECGNMVFPKIQPAVIVGVRNGDKLLMTKYAGRAFTHYALVAGFAEIGETIEETVAREVMEETGVKVKNITYYASQPWGFDADLLMGFYCDLDGSEQISMDDGELAAAEWIDRANVPLRSDTLSLTSFLINQFREGKDKDR